jgi:hypothetical protein
MGKYDKVGLCIRSLKDEGIKMTWVGGFKGY